MSSRRAGGLLAAALLLTSLACVAFVPHQAGATVATRDQMLTVGRNWLRVVTQAQGTWAGSTTPSIEAVVELRRDGQELGLALNVDPDGFIVVPALLELAPIKAYSERGRFELSDGLDPNGWSSPAGRLRASTSQPAGRSHPAFDLLAAAIGNYVDVYGHKDASRPPWEIADRKTEQLWERLLTSTARSSPPSAPVRLEQNGPLLTSAWHQGEPYNELAPLGEYGWSCPAGCVAIAVGQILRYHAWPPSGVGRHAYWWPGDDSCSGDTPGDTLRADFSDAYDWQSMPDACAPDGPPEQRAALSELCYEIGVACEMDYGACGSETSTPAARSALVQYYRCHSLAQIAERNNYDANDWFGLVRSEIDGDRPIYYDILTHAGVVDGWRVAEGMNQYHFNYGWGGPQTAWYTVDEIWGSQAPQYERMIRWIFPETESPFLVEPDGSGIFPTIQAAIDATSHGDVVLLAPGVYRGDGNRDLRLNGKMITIRSQTGNPLTCVLDCEGTEGDAHRSFNLQYGEGPQSVIEGITVVSRYSGPVNPGAVYCGSTAPTIRNCRFTGAGLDPEDAGPALMASNSQVRLERCVLSDHGADTVFLLVQSDVAFEECTFARNGDEIIWCYQSNVTVLRSTFLGDPDGPASQILLRSGSAALIENSLFAFGGTAPPISCATGTTVAVRCSDIFGFQGGDWTGCLEGLLGVDGNISADPLFCDQWSSTALPNLYLADGSPCAADANPECSRIGAWPVGCEFSEASKLTDRALRPREADETRGESAPRTTARVGDAASTNGRATSSISIAPNPLSSQCTIVLERRSQVTPSSTSPQGARPEGPGDRETAPAGIESSGDGVESLRVLDVTGRVVCRLGAEPTAQGSAQAVWDGRDATGRRLPSGIYFVVWSHGIETAAERIFLMR